MSPIRSISFFALLFGFGLLLNSCDKGDEVENLAPDTRIGLEAINLTGENRLNSTVRLTWYGSDQDGYVKGYEISFDAQQWTFVTNQDSSFLFSIGDGLDSVDIDFFVRAIDDDDLADPSPAYLKIPLKNTPPTAEFDEAAMPIRDVPLVMTFRWNFDDQDGPETVESAFIKINDGDWYEIEKNENLFSIIATDPTATGPVDAYVYSGLDQTPRSETINGLVNNDSNTVYIKVTDVAGSESAPDTSITIFVRNQSADLLFLNGEPNVARDVYSDVLDDIYPTYDLVDLEANGGEAQPKFWIPTYRILVSHYDKIFFNSDVSQFSNPLSGQAGVLLDFAAPVLQEHIDNGGKSFIIASFPDDIDLSFIAGIMPIDSLSSSNGQAFLTPDSTIVPTLAGYPELTPANILFGLDPFYLTVDAEPFYTANYSTNGGWTGPVEVGALRRRNQTDINQIFFTVGLYQFNGNPQPLTDLFNKVLNDDFNW